MDIVERLRIKRNDVVAQIAADEIERLRQKNSDPHQYYIGPLTFDQVFRANQLENLSDMQAVLDAVEKALSQ